MKYRNCPFFARYVQYICTLYVHMYVHECTLNIQATIWPKGICIQGDRFVCAVHAVHYTHTRTCTCTFRWVGLCPIHLSRQVRNTVHSPQQSYGLSGWVGFRLIAMPSGTGAQATIGTKISACGRTCTGGWRVTDSEYGKEKRTRSAH